MYYGAVPVLSRKSYLMTTTGAAAPAYLGMPAVIASPAMHELLDMDFRSTDDWPAVRGPLLAFAACCPTELARGQTLLSCEAGPNLRIFPVVLEKRRPERWAGGRGKIGRRKLEWIAT